MDTKQDLTICAGTLEATLRVTSAGASLTALTDLTIDKTVFHGEKPLMRLTLRTLADGTDQELDTSDGWDSCALTGNTLVFRRTGVTLILGWTVDGVNSSIAWTSSVQITDPAYSVTEAVYPPLYSDCGSSVRVFHPYACGIVHKTEDPMNICTPYPSYGASMEYMALWDEATGRGIYCGIHDRHGSFKWMAVSSDGKTAAAEAKYPCTDLGRSANSQTLPGQCVWRAYSGGWFEAAMIYKAWVMAGTDFTPPADHANVPDWMMETSHWWLTNLDETGNYLKTLYEAEADLGVSSGVHLYCWHRNPFDNDYPHYFPVIDRFPADVAEMQNRGFHVMPYINGRLWDTRDQGDRDWLFTTLAKQYACKDDKGELITEIYDSKESDGSPVVLAVMCPTTARWSDKVYENCIRLMKDYGVDAVYVDQIASAPPHLCCDDGHSHPAGGGSWWIEAYSRMAERINLALPRSKTITTEGTSDAYMKNIGGYLSWDWVYDGQVPAVTAVYAGRVAIFGRCYGVLRDPMAVRIISSQSWMSGEGMGWIGPGQYLGLEPATKQLYRAMVRSRAEYARFFLTGEMVCPPAVKSDLPDVVGQCDKEPLHSAAVTATLWRGEDGKLLVQVVNIVDSVAEVMVASPEFAGRTGEIPGGSLENGMIRLTLAPATCAAFVLE